MGWTDDPIADFLRHDAEQEEWLRSRPKCCICGEHIQDEQAYLFEYTKRDKWICEDCMRGHLKYVDDYT